MDSTTKFGKCPVCKHQRNALAWCGNCDIAYLKDNFKNWTSGNSELDDFIRHTQLSANRNSGYLEWVEFDQFELIENVNKQGAFGSVYFALWLEGPRRNLDIDEDTWIRSGPTKVILKRLDDSLKISETFINQLYDYFYCLQNDELAHYFGITKDRTSCYMFVMKYYEHGDLYSYFNHCDGIIYWRDILDILLSISEGINVIHELNLVHGHLHGGNILFEPRKHAKTTCDVKIADTGLHGPANKQIWSPNIYGMIPFVAPEVLRGCTPTKESDIYSFGMLMWTLSSCKRPYHNRPHDYYLVREICSGLRPTVVSGTPPSFAQLMLQCLDGEPSNRPTAIQLVCYFEYLTRTARTHWSPLSYQLSVADEIKSKNFSRVFKVPSYQEDPAYYSRSSDSVTNTLLLRFYE